MEVVMTTMFMRRRRRRRINTNGTKKCVCVASDDELGRNGLEHVVLADKLVARRAVVLRGEEKTT